MFSRFEKKEAFTFVGGEGTFPQSECPKAIPPIIEKVVANKDKIKNIVGYPHGVSLGLEDGILNYLYGYEVTKVEDLPEGLVAKEIPTQEYAVILHKGKIDTIVDTYHYFFSTWLSENGYECVKSPCFETYGEKYIESGPNVDDSIVEIYFPVKKKE